MGGGSKTCGRLDGQLDEPGAGREEADVIIDCDTCTVRGAACGDCVVAVLLGAPPALDGEQQRALGVLAASGLVPPLRLAPDPGLDSEFEPSCEPSTSPDVNNDTPGRSTRAV